MPEEALQRTTRGQEGRLRGTGRPVLSACPGCSVPGPSGAHDTPPESQAGASAASSFPAVPKPPSFLPRPLSCFEDKLAVSSGAESGLPETPSQPRKPFAPGKQHSLSLPGDSDFPKRCWEVPGDRWRLLPRLVLSLAPVRGGRGDLLFSAVRGRGGGCLAACWTERWHPTDHVIRPSRAPMRQVLS